MKKIIKMIFVVVGLLTSQLSLAGQTPDGKMSTYYDNGAKKSDKFYRGGVPVGVWSSWYKSGNPQTTVKFLDETGQIEKIDVLYESGSVMYTGVATVSKEPGEKEMTITFIDRCSAKSTKKGNGSKWYNKYELSHSSFYEDGSCEEAIQGNMYRAVAQLYFRVVDKTTGNVYDFPQYKQWGTVHDYLKKKESDSK